MMTGKCEFCGSQTISEIGISDGSVWRKYECGSVSSPDAEDLRDGQSKECKNVEHGLVFREAAEALRLSLAALPNPDAKSGKFFEVRQQGHAVLSRINQVLGEGK